jgi:hypothetical protein
MNCDLITDAPGIKYTANPRGSLVSRDNIAYPDRVIYLTFGDKKRPSE